MLVLAALEGRKLEPDFNYPQHSARVTSWDVNIYFDWLLALIAGPVEIIATGEYTIDGTRYTFTGQYTRVVDPVTANTLARTLRGSTQTIWFDPTDPQVASWQPLNSANRSSTSAWCDVNRARVPSWRTRWSRYTDACP